MQLLTKYHLSSLVTFFVLIRTCIPKTYHNFTLFRGIPDTERKLNFLKDLGDLYSANYWRYPGSINMPIDFVIAPEMVNTFLAEAILQGVHIKTLLEDIQSAFNIQTVTTYTLRSRETFNWKSYFRLNDIYNWLSDLKEEYPDRLHLENIGRTFENREIIVAKIILPGSVNRPKVIVEGGIHAREWISVSFVTYFLYQVLTAPESNNNALIKMANEYEWYFIPILNPDGYEHTHTNDRLFRKNLRHVDLNRNFDYAFGTTGVSYDQSNEVYCGEAAFSEAESTAIRYFCDSKKDNLKYYLAFHSYGQFLIIPYGNTSQHLDNYDQMKKMGAAAAKRIAQRYSTRYKVGTAQETVGYLTSGSSTCWVKQTFKVPYVLTIELRDEGNFAFALPPDQILPTCLETMDGVISLLEPDNGDRMKHMDTPTKDNKHSMARANGNLCSFKVYGIFIFIYLRASITNF